MHHVVQISHCAITERKCLWFVIQRYWKHARIQIYDIHGIVLGQIFHPFGIYRRFRHSGNAVFWCDESWLSTGSCRKLRRFWDRYRSFMVIKSIVTEFVQAQQVGKVIKRCLPIPSNPFNWRVRWPWLKGLCSWGVQTEPRGGRSTPNRLLTHYRATWG